jgi:tetratricopeptide (TPR) repeat protein
VRWGQLYADTHQNGEAYKLFQEALKLEPRNAWAHVAAAEALIDSYSKEGQVALESALQAEDAPAGARFKTLLLAARVTLESGEQDDATKQLEQAATLANAENLPKTELNALLAAQAQLRGRDNAALVAEVLRERPGYGELYLTLAHFYDIRRLYTEATALYRKAVEVQPDLWEARVQLATALLRESRQSEARALFEEAYKGDPYNPVTANTLRLLDQLSKFDTLLFPEAPAGAAVSAPQIVVRVNKKESAVLAPYVQALAEQAMAQYSRRYRYTLSAPVTIEIYNNHEDFAVRTAGMPGLGLLGVTFGHVLAMDSPSSRAVNEFHWGSTLWHELAHVYTLESTGHRVPRWLSEGISVYEEWSSGPTQGISVPGYAWAALAAGKALPIADLDRGFIRPEYEQQVQVSYMQAGLICEFVVKKFGQEKLVNMLGQYTRGADTPAAVKAALGLSVGDFDRQFGEYLHQDFGTVLSGLKPWSEARAAATKAAKAKNWSEAIASAQRALQILPVDVEDGSPYVPLAEAQFATGQKAEAVATLTSFWQRGGHDPQALARLANEYHALGRKADAVAVMQSINYVAPFDDAHHGRMGDWLLELNRPQDALTEYKVALALQPADGATANYRLAQAYAALDRKKEARAAVLRALEIAPSFRPAQQLLLQLAGATNKT